MSPELLVLHYLGMCAGIENEVEKFVDPTREPGSVGFPFRPEVVDAVYQQAKGGGD